MVQILIADDDPNQLSQLQEMVGGWGYDVALARDGLEAWEQLAPANSPHMAILDWAMPRMSGLEVCRQVRLAGPLRPVYVVLLTARNDRQDMIAALRSGADDYVVKPFHPDELLARVHVGLRHLELQERLTEQVHELKSALAHIHQLRGMLPICSYCKKIRNDQNYWEQVEAYFVSHSDIKFSHGICPDCMTSVVQPMLDEDEAP
jgi:DNA-binding response OmpR family regulator